MAKFRGDGTEQTDDVVDAMAWALQAIAQHVPAVVPPDPEQPLVKESVDWYEAMQKYWQSAEARKSRSPTQAAKMAAKRIERALDQERVARESVVPTWREDVEHGEMDPPQPKPPEERKSRITSDDEEIW
jgi:hypothetical protein